MSSCLAPSQERRFQVELTAQEPMPGGMDRRRDLQHSWRVRGNVALRTRLLGQNVAPVDATKEGVSSWCPREKRGFRGVIRAAKINAVVQDARASKHQMIWVVDESGEDYLYPAGYFVAIELPQEVEEALSLAA